MPVTDLPSDQEPVRGGGQRDRPHRRRRADIRLPRTERSREDHHAPHLVYAPAGQAGLVTADPAVRNFLLQIQQRGPTPLRLARLDLATGRVTDLPSGWLVPPGAVLTW